jgi:hypothetical protein
MQYLKRQYDPILLAIINMLGAASLMGFLYCLAVLLHGIPGFAKTDVTLYLVWFGISMLSVYVMKKGDIWGAYALGIATVAITIYDLARGMATIGGATLGTIVMLIVISYIRTATPIDEMDSQATILS